MLPTDEKSRRDPTPRARIAALDISEAEIRSMVDEFYDRVRSDSLLAPLFASIDADGWALHLEKMHDFWSSLLLASGRYKGAPMAVHLAMPHLDVVHFERWLTLFRENATDLFEDAVARVIIGKAENVARSLHYGIASSRSELSSWDPTSSVTI